MIIRDDLTEHNDDEEINEVEVHTIIFITLKDKRNLNKLRLKLCQAQV